MKIIVFIILSFNLANADYLLGHLERCAKEYYYSYDSSSSKYKLYYLNSRTNNWNSTTANVGFIDNGYIYDSSTKKCTKTQNLGLTLSQYNFLYAFIGLIFGGMLFWLVPSSKK
jgi:hypothetical protein